MAPKSCLFPNDQIQIITNFWSLDFSEIESWYQFRKAQERVKKLKININVTLCCVPTSEKKCSEEPFFIQILTLKLEKRKMWKNEIDVEGGKWAMLNSQCVPSLNKEEYTF